MTPADSPDRGLRFVFPDGELEGWFGLGAVTDRSIRVWARCPEGPAVVSMAIDGRSVAQATITPDREHDHVGAVTLTLDTPRPGAGFTVELGGALRSGRLAPAAGEPGGFSFAFGSCHQPFGEHPLDGRLSRQPRAGIYPRARELLVERGADFLMLLGDQVYSDAVSRISVRRQLARDPDLTDQELLDTYRHLYRGYFNERGFRQLAELLPTYFMWDDHDIFDGWGSLLHPTDFDRRLFAAANGAFREYQHLRNPNASLHDDAPYAFGFWHADVGFFVLDLRACRDYDAGRILGDRQWARLDAFLAEADARDVPTVFIGASVPVVHDSPALMAALERWPTGTGRDIRDRWTVPAFRHEREALVNRLFAWQSARPRRQVVLLSGDVHVAAAFNVRARRGPGRAAQWTSSALSTPSGIQHALGNRLVTRLARLGESSLRVWRRGITTGNNVGVVGVEPLPDGGHALTFTVHEYDAKRDRLRPGLIDRSLPES